MRLLENSEYQFFEKLVSLNQKSMRAAMVKYLKSIYDNCIITQDYIVAIGDIPIALVAHMDTVYATPVSNLYYDREKNVLWSPEGLGADDRAGIYAIITLTKMGYRPSVILTTDEEKGGKGASALAKLQPCPIPNLKYMIELDRQGIDDCVFYDCFNSEFIEYVQSFGFKHDWGTFSDISFLMGDWKICGVNLSIGYFDEHSYSERLYVDAMYKTIERVTAMLTTEDIPDFQYVSLYETDDFGTYAAFGQRCSKCKKLFSEYELFPVKGLDGKLKFFCPDCMVGNVDWCNVCQDAYEIDDPKKARHLCNDCREDYVCMKTSKNNSKQ